MSWTINNIPVADLGVQVAGWSETALTINTLTLEVVQRDYTADLPAELEHGSWVVLARDGVTMFQGRVTRAPRNAAEVSEGVSYEVSDAFWVSYTMSVARRFAILVLARSVAKSFLLLSFPLISALSMKFSPRSRPNAFLTLFLLV